MLSQGLPSASGRSQAADDLVRKWIAAPVCHSVILGKVTDECNSIASRHAPPHKAWCKRARTDRRPQPSLWDLQASDSAALNNRHGAHAQCSLVFKLRTDCRPGMQPCHSIKQTECPALKPISRRLGSSPETMQYVDPVKTSPSIRAYTETAPLGARLRADRFCDSWKRFLSMLLPTSF